MSRFSNIAVRHEHADRAREIAKHFEMNTGGLVGTLIDLEYRRVFGREPEPVEDLVPTLKGKHLRLKGKDGQAIELPLRDASTLATMIYDAATKGGESMSLDGPEPISVSLKGMGVVIVGWHDDGSKSKITLPRDKAKLFATRLHELLVSHMNKQ